MVIKELQGIPGSTHGLTRVLLWHLPGGIGDQYKLPVRIVGLWPRSEPDLTNAKPKRYLLNCNVQHIPSSTQCLFSFYVNSDCSCAQASTMYMLNPVANWWHTHTHTHTHTYIHIYIHIYICHTALLTSRCCILNIYSTDICTEYFKHAA
jgi:hypothetical protein